MSTQTVGGSPQRRSPVKMPSASAAMREPQRPNVRAATLHSLALAAACYVSYWLTAHVVSEVHSLSAADNRLGAMWAVIATVFVYRTGYQQDVGAALSRTAATAFSCALCVIYLLILPFSSVGLVVLIGIGTLILTLTGRSGDIVTAGITTTVVMVVAALAPHDAWQEPILRAADTAAGVTVGLAAASIGSRVMMLRSS